MDMAQQVVRKVMQKDFHILNSWASQAKTLTKKEGISWLGI
jgi:hypothetical protein